MAPTKEVLEFDHLQFIKKNEMFSFFIIFLMLFFLHILHVCSNLTNINRIVINILKWTSTFSVMSGFPIFNVRDS